MRNGRVLGCHRLRSAFQVESVDYFLANQPSGILISDAVGVNYQVIKQWIVDIPVEMLFQVAPSPLVFLPDELDRFVLVETIGFLHPLNSLFK